MICSMVSERRYGLTVASTKVTTKRVRSMAEVYTYGRTAPCMTEIGSRTESRDTVNISGKMGVNTSENGRIITCTVKEFTPGPMAGDTRENTKWTKSTGMASTSGLMEDNMRAIGSTESSMGKVNTSYKIKASK